MGIRVSPHVHHAFRTAVFEKHAPRIYGALREEADAALLAHIERLRQAAASPAVHVQGRAAVAGLPIRSSKP